MGIGSALKSFSHGVRSDRAPILADALIDPTPQSTSRRQPTEMLQANSDMDLLA